MENPETVRCLQEIKRRVEPKIFLMETKKPNSFVLNKVEDIGYTYNALVPPHGHGGRGLILLWKQEIQLEVISSCDNYTDARINYEGKRFYSTFVYGNPNKALRKQMWNHLIELAMIRDEPWFISDDFNDILDNSEKEGGQARSEGSFGDFRTFLLKVIYMISGIPAALSWRGSRRDYTIDSRLDRAISNSSWPELFPSG